MTRDRPDAIFMVSDSLTTINRKRVIDFADAQRIPAMFEFSVLVENGGLMSYGPSFDDAFQRIAYYVDRIIKGASQPNCRWTTDALLSFRQSKNREDYCDQDSRLDFASRRQGHRVITRRKFDCNYRKRARRASSTAQPATGQSQAH